MFSWAIAGKGLNSRGGIMIIPGSKNTAKGFKKKPHHVPKGS